MEGKGISGIPTLSGGGYGWPGNPNGWMTQYLNDYGGWGYTELGGVENGFSSRVFEYEGNTYFGGVEFVNGQAVSMVTNPISQVEPGAYVQTGEYMFWEASSNGQQSSGGGFPYQESVAGGGFFIGGLAGSFESGFDLGARSLEQVKVVTGRAANGAYITESRNAVSLANKSAYVRATSTANVLKIGGRIVGGGVVAYNGLNLLSNGGTDRQVAQFVTQSIITGVGFLGPIGFGVSLGLTAIEMAGGFDFLYDSFDNTKINRVSFD